MNWLAHLYLSPNDIHFQLGNILADPLKGKVWEGAPLGLKLGMETHGKIDAFTDNHEVVKRSKARFEGKLYLKGVIVDLIYDHYLTKHWSKFSDIDRKTFVDQFYQNTAEVIHDYPEEVRAFSQTLITYDRLNRYETLEQVKEALTRIDKRLSPELLKRESCESYFPLIEEHYAELEKDFLEFFPELKNYVSSLN